MRIRGKVHAVVSSPGPAAFALRASLLAAVFLGSYLLVPHHLLLPAEEALAVATTEILRAFGIDAVRQAAVVSSPLFSVRIIDECLGIELALLTAAFILAYPAATHRSRLMALLAAVPLLAAVNLMRITFVFMISSWNNRLFEISHIYLGQCFMLIVTVALFMLWISTINDGDHFSGKKAFFMRLLVSSSVLFILWIFLQKPYVFLTDTILTKVMSAFSEHPMRFSEKTNYDYTFSVVTFFALLAAEHPMSWKMRLRAAFTGSAVLVAVHFAFRSAAMVSLLRESATVYEVSVAIYAFLTFLLPLLLWLTIRSRRRMIDARTCPHCGAVKTGLADHIRAKHGGEQTSRTPPD